MKNGNHSPAKSATFSPQLAIDQPLVHFWLKQATIRLRREICWMRQQRGLPAAAASLPPPVNQAEASLGLQWQWEEKKRFMTADATARYLTDQLAAAPPSLPAEARGSFGWVVQQLQLSSAAAFTLALALLSAYDSAAGAVIAACQNDQARTLSTLALAQRLWDEPEEIPPLADPAHALFRFGLLHLPTQAQPLQASVDWDIPVAVSAPVAQLLLHPDAPLPGSLVPLEGGGEIVPAAISSRMPGSSASGLRIHPIVGKTGAAYRDTLLVITRQTGAPIRECRFLPGFPESSQYLKAIVTLAWLKNFDLYLGQGISALLGTDPPRIAACWLSLQPLPINIYLGISDRKQTAAIPAQLLEPLTTIPTLSFQERRALWHEELGAHVGGLESEIDECARRFRYEKETIRSITAKLHLSPLGASTLDLIAACRGQIDLNMGELAQRVTPRFRKVDLVLPGKELRQFREVAKAMNALTEVHYRWGTAGPWNESGISVLFAGPPGTGKTMAAEILADELNLPMFRIDLSQVVNKYIGETEKNLKQLFDAADVSDVILFFDEADSLFGRRTEVKDAHDRYANLEISYLLERMERFKGLAILATNRKKDLDEAFLRRLRYIINFPFPEIEERLRIWKQIIPGRVDVSAIDFQFLARQFQLTGGHIASIVFNACLQSTNGRPAASASYLGRLTMEALLTAVQREYGKMDRALNPELFGSYTQEMKRIEAAKE